MGELNRRVAKNYLTQMKYCIVIHIRKSAQIKCINCTLSTCDKDIVVLQSLRRNHDQHTRDGEMCALSSGNPSF